MSVMHKPSTSSYKSQGGFRRIIKAFGYSIQGIKAAIRYESAFRQEGLLALILFPLAFWLGRHGLEIFLLCFSITLVLIIELLNSAIEALADSISTEHHPLLGRAKDMGSAAVLLSLLSTGSWWLYVIADRFFLN